MAGVITFCETCGVEFRTHHSHKAGRFCTVKCRRSQTVVQRFARFVQVGEPNACWEWTGFRIPDGYGQITIRSRQRTYKAHRLAWEIAHGPIPEGLQVCHKCDNPPCCNPAHLFLGTARDNVMDRERKGRSFRPHMRKAS